MNTGLTALGKLFLKSELLYGAEAGWEGREVGRADRELRTGERPPVIVMPGSSGNAHSQKYSLQ
jgi:hypothetical protein